jgi:hypothetical protein
MAVKMKIKNSLTKERIIPYYNTKSKKIEHMTEKEFQIGSFEF